MFQIAFIIFFFSISARRLFFIYYFQQFHSEQQEHSCFETTKFLHFSTRQIRDLFNCQSKHVENVTRTIKSFEYSKYHSDDLST